MGGRTYRYYNFREYEGGAFSRYLEEMAGKGWYNKAVHAAESGASLNSSTLGQIKIRSSLKMMAFAATVLAAAGILPLMKTMCWLVIFRGMCRETFRYRKENARVNGADKLRVRIILAVIILFFGYFLCFDMKYIFSVFMK